MSRRYIAGLIILCCALAFVARAQVTDRYINERYHYSVTMPEGWVRVPEEVAQKHFERLVGDPAQADALQDYVFQPGGKSWFTFPYAVVQVIPYVDADMTSSPETAAMRAFVARIAGIDVNAVLQGRIEKKTNIAGGSLSEPTFDPATRTFAYTVRVNRGGQGDIVGEAHGWFGRDVIVQITFYNVADQWDQSAAAREFLVAGFAFAPESAYPEVPAPVAVEAVPERSPWEGYLGWGLIVGLSVLAIVIGLCWAALRRKPS
ncbi:MAG: hypothetical protein IT368_17125 [Candidatus Hydrogenedentes bacterium]|nr:hypothetical protein [Candidatus Hydrogenedentota bacterium]